MTNQSLPFGNGSYDPTIIRSVMEFAAVLETRPSTPEQNGRDAAQDGHPEMAKGHAGHAHPRPHGLTITGAGLFGKRADGRIGKQATN
jgi:hypothetical protein